MTPQDQEFLHDPENGVLGDCLRACVASVLDLDRAEVPHFVELGDAQGDTDEEGLAWWNELSAWLYERDLEIWYLETEDIDSIANLLEYSALENLVVSGKAQRPRGLVAHVCVAEMDGHIIHDPNPSRDGLALINGYFIIVRQGTWANLDV